MLSGHQLGAECGWQTTAQEYEQQFREREIRHLQRKAARLGFSLTPIPEAGSVS